MRTPEEINKIHFRDNVDFTELIAEIQKEAYNQAIDDVHTHKKVKYLPTMNGMKIQLFVTDLFYLKK